MISSLPPGALRSMQIAGRPLRRILPSLLLLALLVSGLFAFDSPAPPVVAAAGPAFPPYVYVVVSGPASYDVMRVAGGKESRLARVGVAGVGFGDVAAKMAPDGQHVAVRVTGDRTGGSSLRIIDVQSSKTITVTLSRSSDIGHRRIRLVARQQVARLHGGRAANATIPTAARARSGWWAPTRKARASWRRPARPAWLAGVPMAWASTTPATRIKTASVTSGSSPCPVGATPALRSSPGSLQYSALRWPRRRWSRARQGPRKSPPWPWAI